MTALSAAMTFTGVILATALCLGLAFLFLRALPRLLWAAAFARGLAWSVMIGLVVIVGAAASVATGGRIALSGAIAVWTTVVMAPWMVDTVAWLSDRGAEKTIKPPTPRRGYVLARRRLHNDRTYVPPGES